MHNPFRSAVPALLACLAVSAPLWAPMEAHATAYTINTTNVDQIDDGKCSLLEASFAINQLAAVNTDDCPAGSNSANTITVPAGTYIAKQMLRFRRPVTILGAGMYKTVIAADFAYDTELLFFDNGLTGMNAIVRGLTLRKDRADFAASGVLAEDNAGITGTSVRLVQVRVTGFTNSGIYGVGANWTIDSCLIEGNSSFIDGGGIRVDRTEESSAGTWMRSTSVVNNVSQTGGGGIYHHADGNSNIFNCTFAGNQAKSGKGGGLLINITQGGYFDLFNCTVTGNSASVSGGGIANMGTGTPPHFNQSIVAKNTAPSGKDASGWVGALNTIFGEYTGNDAPQDPSVIAPVPTPGLLTLVETGWPLGLKIVPITASSPALEKATGMAGEVYGVDGRGYPRPQDGNLNGTATSDLGAFEYDALRLETEGLVFVKSSDAHTTWANDREYSMMGGSSLAADAANDYVTYTAPNVPTGIYNVKVRLKKNNNRGIFQFGVATAQAGSFSDMGSPYDAYSASAAFTEKDFGNVQFTGGGQKFFRFKVTGKNASSSGYQVFVDYIRLTKQ